MPFVNLDDGYAEHPKHEVLSDGAFRLLTAAICYCNKHKTDGLVPTAKLSRLVPRYRPSHLKELLTNHRTRPDVVEVPDGYYVRDYLQWNRSRQQIEDAHEKNRKRQQKWREEHRNDDGTFHD